MYFLFTALLLLYILRRFLVVITVLGRSMEPALFSGDRVLLVRLRFQWILQQGQLVVCKYTGDIPTDILESNKQAVNELTSGRREKQVNVTVKQTYYIKRLWGLGGDQVVIPALDLPAPSGQKYKSLEWDAAVNFVWQVPPGYCFVKGDHTAYSYDSTSWGPIPLDHIVGIVLFKLPRRTELSEPTDEGPAVLPVDLSVRNKSITKEPATTRPKNSGKK